MFKLLQLLIFLLFPLSLFAQIDWAHHIGSEFSDHVENHVIDLDGNIIIVGHFGGTVTIGNQNFTSVGDSDIYFYKTSPAGKVIWAKTLRSPSYTGDVGLAVDKAGNIFIAGGFIEQLTFEDKNILAGNKSWNTFICKLNTDGKLIWVKGIVGNIPVSEARGFGVLDANEAGEVVITANISGEVKFEDVILNTHENSRNNLVIAKYSSDGELEWYNNPTADTNTQVWGVKLGNDGQVYFTGFYSSNLTLGNDRLSVSTEGHGEIFLAKLNDIGIPVWAKSFNKTELANLNNTGIAIEADEQTQEVYITGNFKGKIALDNIQFTADNTTEENANGDIFFAKLTAGGNVIWGKHLGTSGSEFAHSIVFNKDGLLVLSGTLKERPFMHVYDKDGTQVDGYSLDGYGWISSTTYINDKEYYMSGVFRGIFQDKYFRWDSNESDDGFLVKVGSCLNESIPPEKPLLSNTCTSISYDNYASFGAVEWYRDGIKIEFESGKEILNPETGYYQVSIRNNCGISYSDKLYFKKEDFLPPSPIIVQTNCKTLVVQNPGDYNIAWYRNGQLISDNSSTVLSIKQGGMYTVRFTTECGFTENTIQIDAPDSPKNYAFYNIITPNGDSKNEYFILDPALISSSLQIFSRWGNKVFESKNYQNDWNGAGLASGVYFWTINNECLGTQKGTVTIIR